MKKLSITILLIIASFSALLGQPETLKVMQYNLLNYGNNTGYCNTTNNNVSDKNNYIRTILTAYYPDIFTVCEIGRSSSLPNDFVNNVLNINGLNYWMTSPGSNTGNTSSLINCIFYNSTKLTLVGHHVAQTYTRDVDVYDFKFKNDESDRVTLTCVIAHLKAGTGSDNESKRKMMVENTMRYRENNYRERNVPNSYFIDPLYPYGVGNWNSNYNFKEYHTQSTHKDSDSNCHSSGGMDDRFDFILMSENIYGGRENIRYVGGSYNALGNDGNRFNKSINNPTNQAVSQEVANALFHNSDHIPVTMDLVVSLNEDVNELNANELSYDVFPNPASSKINLRFYQNNSGRANILLFNTLGQAVFSENIFVNDCLSEHVINVENLPKGFYFLKITNADGLTDTIKIAVE